MKIYCVLCVLFFSFNTIACDICGCSAQGTSLGLLPNSGKHFIGLRYNFRRFRTVHPPMGLDSGGEVSEDYFHSFEVWGRYTLLNRIQIYGFIPVKHTSQIVSHVTNNVSGVGDVSLLISGVILQPKDSLIPGEFNHAWSIGFGVKAPTGAYRRADAQTGIILPNMQTGTGSWDFSLVSNYRFGVNNWGLNINGSYRYNLPNKFRYQFGSRALLAAHVFRNIHFPKTKMRLIPQLGLVYDYAAKDFKNLSKNEINEFSGGNFLHGEVRLDYYINNFGLSIGAALPIAQNYGKGYVESKYRLSAGIKIIF